MYLQKGGSSNLEATCKLARNIVLYISLAASIAAHIQVPKHWSPMTDEQFVMAVELKPSDKEYKLVARRFKAGVNYQRHNIKVQYFIQTQ